MSKALVTLLQRATVAVWISAMSLLLYHFLEHRMRMESIWPPPPSVAPNFRPLMVPESFTMLPRTPCPVFLAVVVCSAPDHVPERLAIRDTWAREAKPGHTAVYFLLGNGTEDTGRRPTGTGFRDATLASSANDDRESPDKGDPHADSSILPESSLFGDIIRANFADTTSNQTLKTLLMLEWVKSFCPRVSFILKAEDDAYLDLPGLVSLLETKNTSPGNQTQPDRHFLLGKIIQGKVSDEESISRQYKGARGYAPSNLPSYLSGAAYVVPGTVIRPMLEKALDIPSLSFEDVFMTGVVASALSLELIHSNCFQCCDELPDSCAYRGLLAATVSNPDSLRTVWKQVRGLQESNCLPSNHTTGDC